MNGDLAARLSASPASVRCPPAITPILPACPTVEPLDSTCYIGCQVFPSKPLTEFEKSILLSLLKLLQLRFDGKKYITKTLQSQQMA